MKNKNRCETMSLKSISLERGDKAISPAHNKNNYQQTEKRKTPRELQQLIQDNPDEHLKTCGPQFAQGQCS